MWGRFILGRDAIEGTSEETIRGRLITCRTGGEDIIGASAGTSDKTGDASGTLEASSKTGDASGTLEASSKTGDASGTLEAWDASGDETGTLEASSKTGDASGTLEASSKTGDASGTLEASDETGTLEASGKTGASDDSSEDSTNGTALAIRGRLIDGRVEAETGEESELEEFANTFLYRFDSCDSSDILYIPYDLEAIDT